MPTKRKSPESEEQKDLTKPLYTRDIPRKFQHIMNAMNAPKTKNTSINHNVSKNTKLEKLREGETMREFAKRVDEKAQDTIASAFQRATKTKLKKKEALKMRKLKKKQKSQEEITKDVVIEQRLKEKQMHDTRFGVRAEAPPVNLPTPKIKAKKIEKNDLVKSASKKRIVEDERQRLVAHYRLQKQRRAVDSHV